MKNLKLFEQYFNYFTEEEEKKYKDLETKLYEILGRELTDDFYMYISFDGDNLSDTDMIASERGEISFKISTSHLADEIKKMEDKVEQIHDFLKDNGFSVDISYYYGRTDIYYLKREFEGIKKLFLENDFNEYIDGRRFGL